MVHRIGSVVLLVAGFVLVGALVVGYFRFRGFVDTMPNAGQEFVLYSDVKHVYREMSQFSLIAFLGGLGAGYLITDNIRNLLRWKSNSKTAGQMSGK